MDLEAMELRAILTVGAGVYLGFVAMTFTRWGLGFAQRALIAAQAWRAYNKKRKGGAP